MSRNKSETKFSFKAFRNLKKGLGEFDAVVECNELAIREFIKNIESSYDKNEFIKALSEKHKIRVDTVRIELFESRIRQFYILSVMQRTEQFIDEFRKEFKTYNPKWLEKDDGETELDNLLRNVYSSKGRGIDGIGKEVYHGYEYYRLARNRFAHSEEKDSKKLESQYAKINEYKGFYSGHFHSFNCPNNYTKIDFNDFLLLTNIVKNIGYTLCEKCKPDNSQLAEKVMTLKTKSDTKTINLLKNISKLKNDPKRFFIAFQNLLNTHFGRINDNDTEEIIKNLSKHSSL